MFWSNGYNYLVENTILYLHVIILFNLVIFTMPTQRCVSVEHLNHIRDGVDTLLKQRKKSSRPCSQPNIDPKDEVEPTKKTKKSVKKRKKFVICANLSMTKYSLGKTGLQHHPFIMYTEGRLGHAH